MRAFVLTDTALASHAGQFVWLAIDTEAESTAAFAEKCSLDAWPTFCVVRPEDEAVILRWVGAMTVAQVREFLDEARFALGGTPPSSAAEEALVRADRLYAKGRNAEAAQSYRQALDAAPARWPRRGRAVEALLFAYQVTDENEKCVALAVESLPRLEATPSSVAVSSGGLDCALNLPESHPARPTALAEMERAVRHALADPRTGAVADDRSTGFLYLVQARKDANDAAGARKTAEEWAAFLEERAAEAATPEQRAVFDSHRLMAYLELSQPERSIPMLEASERDLPGDYNPPARLVVAYKAMKQWDEALAACDRALPKAYGPRKVGLLQTRAELLAEKGAKTAARRALEEALAYAQSLPPAQCPKATIDALKLKLAESETKDAAGKR